MISMLGLMFSVLGFVVSALGFMRFGPGVHQASRIWAWGAPGLEGLGLERARLRRFGPGGR